MHCAIQRKIILLYWYVTWKTYWNRLLCLSFGKGANDFFKRVEVKKSDFVVEKTVTDVG